MGTTVKMFRKNQRGKETNRGDAVAATARWIGDMTLKEKEGLYLPPFPYGVLSNNYSPGFVVAKGAELAYASALTFEEIVDFLIMSLKGGVTPTGAGADKTWTFTHSPTADPAPTTFTVELGNTDGSTAYGRKAEYIFATKLGISAGIDDEMKLTADLVGRQVADAAVTGSLGVPAAWEPAISNKLQVKIAASWAGLDAAPVLSAQVVDMSLDIVTGLRRGKYESGNLYFDSYLFGPLSFDLTMTLEFDGTADAEQEYVRNRTRRFVRLVVLGTALGGSNKKVQFDLSCIHAEDSLMDMFTDRDGNDTAKIVLLGAYDPTSAKDIEAVVVNSLAAIA